MSENIEEQLNNNDYNNDLNMDELLNEQNDDDLLIPLNEQFESINNNISNLKNQNNQKSELLNKMEYLQESIFQSWMKDLDKVNEIIETHNFLEDILNKCESEDDIENYFNNKDEFNYFINKFSKQIIQSILKQYKIYGENGEDKAFEILIDYLKIFLKYIMNSNGKNQIKLHNILDYINEIFDMSKNFYKSQSNYLNESNSKKSITYQRYNELFLKKKNKIKINDIKEGEEIDVLIPSKEKFDDMIWSRGKIISKTENDFSVKVLNNDNPITFSFESFDYSLKGTNTKDWEWRINIQEGDIIDCYERKKIYPATIIKRIEDDNKLEYNVSFRIYLDSVNYDIEKYKIFWPGKEIEEEDYREFIGDKKIYDENIPFTSRRLFPRDTKLTIQEIDFSNYNNDLIYYIDNQVEDIDLNGKKTITIGRIDNYEYYFNCLLNEFGNLNGFDIMIKYIEENINKLENEKEKKNYDNSLIIKLIFSIFKIALPFLYKPLFDKYCDKLSKIILNYVNSLSNNDLRNMKKETIDLMTDILKQCSKMSNNDNKNKYLIEEFSLNFAIKMLKTDFLDKRTSAIKSINDIIKKHKYNNDFKQQLIDLIKQNNIIYEIFGPNSHIQLVRNSKDIIEILLLNDQLSDEELSLIWNGTKTGDLDQKKVIIKILNEILSNRLIYDENIIEKLLDCMIQENTITNDINDDEIELIFSLINKLSDENIIEKYINTFMDFIKENYQNPKLNEIIIQIYEISKNNNQLKYNLINQALEFIKDDKYLHIGYNILTIYLDTTDFSMDFEISSLLFDDDNLLNIYKQTFDDYYNNKEQIDDNLHEKNILNRINFLNILIRNKIWNVDYESPIDYVYQKLVLNKYNDNDEKIFYNWLQSLIKKRNIANIEEQIFKLFTQNDLNDNLSIEGFELFLHVFLEMNKKENKLFVEDQTNTIILKNNNTQKDLIGFPELKKIIFESKNNDIINKGIQFLNDLYLGDTENLVDLCSEEIQNSNNNIEIINKSISILSDLIYLDEENGTCDVKPHLKLIKGEPIIIKCLIDLPYNNNNKIMNINTFSNYSFFSLKNQITKLINYHYDFIKFELINVINNKNSKNQKKIKIELTRHDNGKTLSFLNIKNTSFLLLSSNNLEKQIPESDILDNNNNVTPEAIKIFNDWFTKYSTNNKMDALNLSKFVKDVLNTKEEISINDRRVISLMNEKDSNHDGFIERDEFINWYVTSAINKPIIVLNNIKSMGYRGDLLKISEGYYEENKDFENRLRFILGNNFEFINVLLNKINFGKNNLNAFNFIIMLSTNKTIYDQVLNFESLEFNFEDNQLWGNLYYFCYICFIIEYFIENSNNNESFREWIKKFILEGGYEFFIKAFIKELKEISYQKDEQENIDIVCLGLLIKIIKNIYLSSNESNIENDEFNKFLMNEKLVDKIQKIFTNKEMFLCLINVIDNSINQKWENNIINEIIQLITILIPNINDTVNNDKLIDLIINCLKSENEETRKGFEDSLIKMCTVLISKNEFDIISNLFEKIYLLVFKDKNKNLNDNLFNCFIYLLILYNDNKEKFKLTKNIDINSLANEIINKINDDLTTNFKNPKLSNKQFITYLNTLTKLIDINDSIKNKVNENNEIFINILNKIIFYSGDDEPKSMICAILDRIEEYKFESNDDGLDLINIDKNKNLNYNLSSNKEILKSSYNFVSSLVKNNPQNYKTYLNIKNSLSNNNLISNSYINTSKKNSNQFESKKFGYVGLKNLGSICYLNSTLQQFYMIPTLRYIILKLNDKVEINVKDFDKFKSDEQIDDNMFHQLQKLFSYLLLSERVDYDPYDFIYSFKDFDGNPTKIYEQKDAQEFLAIFLDKLEQSTKNTKYKYIINNIFGGKNCSLITCLECGYVSYNYEPSLFLSLEVKNMKNLNDSLDKFINEEFIDGYECNGCKKKCKISKRNTLALLPNIYIIHLQRLTYNWEIDKNEKINSRLEFPKRINLKNYTIENILKDKENKSENIYFKCDEYYDYNLVGIVVHLGYADSGHYYSYINTFRDGNNNLSNFNPNDENCLNSWFEFNDSSISKFDISNLENDTFGGSNEDFVNNFDNRNLMSGRGFNWVKEKNKNAYLLIYERNVKSPIMKIIDDRNCTKNNLIEFNEDEEYNIFKEYDLMKNFNEDDLNYNNQCKNLYEKIFHNITKDEYFKFEPFYNYNNNKYVPKIYYDEIIKDNKNFKKIKNVSDNQFIEFNNNLINLIGENSINNIDMK